MNLGNQTTFIPKKQTSSIDPERKAVGFFSLISLIIFLGTLIASGGVYFYKYTLEKKIETLKVELDAQKEKFNPQFIKDMTRFNARIEGAKSILSKHVAVSSVFENMQRATIQNVQLQSMTFNSTAVAGKNTVKVSVKGIAQDYGSLAAQAQAVNGNKYIKEPVFSNFQRDEVSKKVNFVLDAVLDARLIDYRERISGNLWKELENATSSLPAPKATTTPTTSNASSTASSTNTLRP